MERGFGEGGVVNIDSSFAAGMQRCANLDFEAARWYYSTKSTETWTPPQRTFDVHLSTESWTTSLDASIPRLLCFEFFSCQYARSVIWRNYVRQSLCGRPTLLIAELHLLASKRLWRAQPDFCLGLSTNITHRTYHRTNCQYQEVVARLSGRIEKAKGTFLLSM